MFLKIMKTSTTSTKNMRTTIKPYQPPQGCRRCPRLVAYRRENRRAQPDWYNGAVQSWGADQPRLLIIGLAPGRTGANRTGRIFTGDGSGAFLFSGLRNYGFAQGSYDHNGQDNLQLIDTLITNAVACAPPENKAMTCEIINCRPFLTKLLTSSPAISSVLCLGHLAHRAFLGAVASLQPTNAPPLRLKDYPFGHGARYTLPDYPSKRASSSPLALFNSFHCSRYNTQTGRLTPQMFANVLQSIRQHLDEKK